MRIKENLTFACSTCMQMYTQHSERNNKQQQQRKNTKDSPTSVMPMTEKAQLKHLSVVNWMDMVDTCRRKNICIHIFVVIEIVLSNSRMDWAQCLCKQLKNFSTNNNVQCTQCTTKRQNGYRKAMTKEKQMKRCGKSEKIYLLTESKMK